jgi:hypothetical protein
MFCFWGKNIDILLLIELHVIVKVCILWTFLLFSPPGGGGGSTGLESFTLGF